MNFDEVVAFVEACSNHLGVDKDDIFEIIMNPEYSASINYTIVTDAHNVWAEAIRFAEKRMAKRIGAI